MLDQTGRSEERQADRDKVELTNVKAKRGHDEHDHRNEQEHTSGCHAAGGVGAGAATGVTNARVITPAISGTTLMIKPITWTAPALDTIPELSTC